MQKGIERGKAGLLCGFAIVAVGALASAQVPDVIVYDVGVNGGDLNDIAYYGQNGGIAAYSIATQSCNAGTEPVDWFDGGGDTRHPVIAQNMFRYKDGHFEQIGQSWLKHGFCAVNEIEAFCAPCQNTNCDTLGIGCADTYWATLNDGGGGRSKRFVNAATGQHTDGTPGPSGNLTIRGRLQVAVSDIDPAQNPGAEYVIEGHYVTADDAAAGVSINNATWRRVVVNSVSNVDGGGASHREIPAIFAWQSFDASVVVKSVLNPEIVGIKTALYLAYRVTSVTPGTWEYEYAVQNLNSDQSVGSYTVPVPPGVLVTNIGFHDVNYHSGDPYDLTDWPGVRNAGNVSWETTPYATNQNANAIRWGTLYNFRFRTNSPPETGSVTLGLFKPGPQSSLTVNDVLVPSATPFAFDKFQQHGDPTGSGSVIAPLVSTRNGGHINPQIFFQESAAIVGQTWKGRVDTTSASMLLVSTAGADQGRITRMGELLIRAPFTRHLTNDGLALAIPSDPTLVGTTFSAQAATLESDGWHLTNALDVTIGSAEAP
jgi:hypothetical protein